MPKVSDKSKHIVKNGMGLPSVAASQSHPEDSCIRTVISVSPPSDAFDGGVDYNDPDQQAKMLVARTLSNRSSMANFVHPKSGHNKKLGHRRVGDDGEVTYKRFETTQLIGSIQLGLEYVLTNEANVPERDLLLPDFMSIETVPFTKDGLLEKTPAHNYSEFRFRIYATHAFRVFRRLFEIDTEFFLSSLCREPMVELSAAGASGSIFYVTRDDNFICKTVQHKEAEFLQKLLPGYYMNLKQNPRTLLPKFFGLYCYSCNTKNVRIIVMNNLLPSGLKMHQKFDLKGSTYKRKASKRERAKNSPTFKDLDFMEMYPDGIFLAPDLYQSLMNSIQRDCRVLESFKIMDYSLLIGIHNVDLANKEKGICNEDASNNLTISDNESSSTGTAGGLNHPPLERQGSFQGRERIIAHSTALESITVEVDSMSIGAGGVGNVTPNAGCAVQGGSGIGGTSANTSHNIPQMEDDPGDDATDSGINNVWGGIPARNKKGENLLLFIGVIDILQSYRMLKKMEHFWKSLIHDGDTVSVHRPGFYAKRFQSFLFDRVFKKQTLVVENKRGTSFRRGNLRRTLSKDQEQTPTFSLGGGNTSSPVIGTPFNGSEKKEPATVTVIRIGDGPNEVNLPYVLQDRGRAPTSGNWVLNRQSSTVQPQTSENNVITINAEVASTSDEQDIPVQDKKTPPTTRNVERPYLKGEADDRQETGSVITMTSDERVQIFVPSPQGTPYNTITKGSATTTMSIGSVNLAPLFAPHRMPNSESYRSLTPLNMSSNSPAHDQTQPPGANTTETTQMVLQETSLEMVKISLVSSSTSTTDKTIANDMDSLPVDQPVSLSQIQLEEVSEEEA